MKVKKSFLIITGALVVSTLVSDMLHMPATMIFVIGLMTILPLAYIINKATEVLAYRSGTAIGAILNVFFGNIVEFIIGIIAIIAGLSELAMASVTGSVLGNTLLIPGLAMLLGGIVLLFKGTKGKTLNEKMSSATNGAEQTFNRTIASANATTLLMTTGLIFAITLIIELDDFLGIHVSQAIQENMSMYISVIFLVIYAANIMFNIVTHKKLLPDMPHAEVPDWSVTKAILILCGTAVVTGFVSEALVGSVEHVVESWGISAVFIGIVPVAILGNAAEHSSGVIFGMKNLMDLALAIALGSAVQIINFVAPSLVIISKLVGHPMSLVTLPIHAVTMFLSALILKHIVDDGKSNWYEGFKLLGFYAIIAVTYWFIA